jgi:hypothetical protein
LSGAYESIVRKHISKYQKGQKKMQGVAMKEWKIQYPFTREQRMK